MSENKETPGNDEVLVAEPIEHLRKEYAWE